MTLAIGICTTRGVAPHGAPPPPRPAIRFSRPNPFRCAWQGPLRPSDQRKTLLEPRLRQKRVRFSTAAALRMSCLKGES